MTLTLTRCRCTPPYYGVDCSLSPLPAATSPPPSPPSPYHLGSIHGRAETTPCAPPCVYVYELPPRMNVLAMKAEPHWPLYSHGPADYRSFIAMHIALLRSKHRTADPRYLYAPRPSPSSSPSPYLALTLTLTLTRTLPLNVLPRSSIHRCL